MKLLHLSDLHLGKRVNEFSMLEDQQYILKQILNIIEEEQPDAVLMAGDIYDKSVPSAEAVQLFDEFLYRLSEGGRQVFVISGNHDSPERLAFGGRLMDRSGIHIAPVYHGHVEPFVLQDASGTVNLYLLPFVKPAQVRKYFPDQEIVSYTDAVRAALEEMGPDPDQRNVLVTHQFVTGAVRCESEEVSVGGLDQVGVSVFTPFDYVALGHIHKPQEVIPGKAAYSGALEPIDKNDMGPHGYIAGELTDRGCQIRFVPAAAREYRPLEIRVTREMTGYQVKELLRSRIGELGKEHMYKARLVGFRDPEVLFDLSGFDVYGNLVELTDGTRPAYDFGKLEETNRENILGAFIREFQGAGEETTEYMALCEGVQALMETRRD